MTVLAVALFVVYVLVGSGFRTWVQWRHTDDAGFRGLSGRFGPSEW